VAKLKKKCGTSTRPTVEKKSAVNNHRRPTNQIQRRFASDQQSNPRQRLSQFFINLNRQFLNMTNFWTRLIPNTCSSVSADQTREFCWNGASLIRFSFILRCLFFFSLFIL
jgi:hypothetical protein